MKILIILSLAAFVSFAHEIQNAKLTAFCDGSVLQIDVYSKDGSSRKTTDLRFSSDCKAAMSDIKLGDFQDYTVSAFCNISELNIINALAIDARISIEIVKLSNSSDCEKAKQSYNL